MYLLNNSGEVPFRLQAIYLLLWFLAGILSNIIEQLTYHFLPVRPGFSPDTSDFFSGS